MFYNRSQQKKCTRVVEDDDHRQNFVDNHLQRQQLTPPTELPPTSSSNKVTEPGMLQRKIHNFFYKLTNKLFANRCSEQNVACI